MRNKTRLAEVSALMAKGYSAKQIMKATGISQTTVYNYMTAVRKKQANYVPKYKKTGAKRMGRPPMRMKTVATFISDTPLAGKLRTAADNVNHPSHYKTGGIETIDFIEAKGLGYHLGNVVKYITRADHKGNKLEDLKKAQWYLNRAVAKLEK